MYRDHPHFKKQAEARISTIKVRVNVQMLVGTLIVIGIANSGIGTIRMFDDRSLVKVQHGSFRDRSMRFQIRFQFLILIVVKV